MTILAATSADNSAAPGTLAFLVFFGMAVILVFVFISMSRHIRRVNDAARREEAARTVAKDAGTASPPGQATTSSSPGPRPT